jgi:3-oxoacyl-[acyl-carrier-protein] synthase III
MTISIRKAGIGSSIRLGETAFLVQKNEHKSPLDVELQMAKHVLDKVLPKKSNVDSLVVVGSLPRVHRNILGASLANICQADFSAVSEFSGGCTSIFDALHHIFCCSTLDETHALVAADSFLSSYGAYSGGIKWSDGAAAILFSPLGAVHLTLRSYATSHHSEFIKMAHDADSEIEIPFTPHHLNMFPETDEKVISDILKASLDSAGISMHDIKCIVTLNRSSQALRRLEKAANERIRIIESRTEYSHSGGSDILINLSLALDAIRHGFLCLLGFGLGYSWRIMILEVNS